MDYNGYEHKAITEGVSAVPRPTKCRRVEQMPEHTYFKPPGVPLGELEEVCLTVEELEAVRLKDMAGLEQEACAERMQVSRPTFHRILGDARAKIAAALVEGKAIRIEGGNFDMAQRKFKCSDCGHEWEAPFGNGQRGVDMECPACHSRQVYRVDTHGSCCGQGHGRSHGHGQGHRYGHGGGHRGNGRCGCRA